MSLASLVRRVAALGLSMFLAFALVITTPTNAQAFDEIDYSKTPAPVITGAVKTAAPALLGAAVRLHPVGFIIGNLISLGTLLYDTRDQWYPYVAGTFGQAEGAAPSMAATQGNIHPANITFNVTKHLNGYSSSFTYSGNEYTSTELSSFSRIRCQNGSTFYERSKMQSDAFGNGTVTNRPRTRTQTNYCDNSAHTLVGYVIGVPNGASDLTFTGPTFAGPVNISRYGTFLDAVASVPAFDPRGAGTTYKARTECIDPSGTKSWIESTTAGNEGAIKFPSCAAAGKGHGTGVMEVKGLRPGGTPLEEKTLWDIPTSPTDPSTPLCDPGRAGSGCTLEVTKNGQPCAVGDIECENWQEDSQKEGNETKYGCKLGPYTVPLSACNLLAKAYRPGGSPATDANTDGDPLTNNDLGPDGKPVEVSAPPVVGTVPGASGQVEPGADENQKRCYPTGWAAFNPVEWVMKPVGCALEKAFIPKSDVIQAQGQRVSTKLATVGFAPMTAAFLGTVDAGVVSGGCLGPIVGFHMAGVDHEFYPFQACTYPMNFVAGITYAVSAIGMVLFGGLGMVRAISSALGFNFTLGSKGGVDA